MEATLTNVFKAGSAITKTYSLEQWKDLPHADIVIEGLDLTYNMDNGVCDVYGITLHDKRTEKPVFHYELDMDDDCTYDVTLDKKILKKLFKLPIELLQETEDYPDLYTN